MVKVLDDTLHEVTVHIFVDGKPYDSFSKMVPDHAVPYLKLVSGKKTQSAAFKKAVGSKR